MKGNKKLFDDEVRKKLFVIFDCVNDIIYDLSQGTIGILYLGMLENLEKFWECYDAIIEVWHT